MRLTVKILQVFVAVLFIISGLVKANDPLGLSYKMQEFFELWNSELHSSGSFISRALRSIFSFFHENSLWLSVIMIALEIVAGVALLIGWSRRFILWLLLVLIIFFTFLTGYAYLSGKFTNCGCFGDCLPITPLTSFLKDILLLVMIIVLIAGQRYITPAFTRLTRTAVMTASVFFSLILQWYVLRYLPFVDCLPFREGNNIAEQMKPPPGSVTDSTAIRFIYEKDGQRYEFAPENLPADFDTYTYIDRIDKLVRKGNAEPPIKGFTLMGESGMDSTEIVLQQPKAVLVFTQNHFPGSWISKFETLAGTASDKNIPVYIISQSMTEARNRMGAAAATAQFFSSDFTMVRTAARTEPAIYFLKNGTIMKKFGISHTGKAIRYLSAPEF